MSDEVKKISFGFSKLVKKTSIVPSQLHKTKVEDNKVEFIDCLESKSIKLKDPVILKEKLLVIPLSKPSVEVSNNIKDELNTNIEQINHDAIGQIDIKPNVVSLINTDKDSELLSLGIKSNVNECKKLTLDEIAAKEILDDLNNKKGQEQSRIFSVPVTNSAPEGEKESTLDDYDNVPITEFGMAMLRGMGWAPGKGIGKNEKLVTPALPTLRPKGMGLGADKVVKVETNSKFINEDFKMCKGSFVRIIAGTHKDYYGQIEGFDDESGRVIVKLPLANMSVSLNEFMVQLVDKVEYTKNSKVINVAKYEQYKDDQGKEENNKNMTKMEKKTIHEEYNSKIQKVSNDTKQNKSEKYNHNYSSLSESESCYNRSKSPKGKKHSKRKVGKRSRSISRSPIRIHERGHGEYSRSSTKDSSLTKTRYEKKYSREERTVKLKSNRRYDSSSDNGMDSNDYSRNKESVTKKKKHKRKSRSRSRSPKYHTDSSDYSRNKKSVTKKKRHKHKSRSRSRSPKHKKKR